MRAAAEDMREALTNPNPNHLVANLPPSQVKMLKELTEILTNASNTAGPPPKELQIKEPLSLPKQVRFDLVVVLVEM